MSDSSSSASSGLGFGGALALLFIGLTLGEVIDWSWWWVLSPLWIGLAVILLIVLVYFAVTLLKAPWE